MRRSASSGVVIHSMNNVIPFPSSSGTNTITMSSREIAELVDSRHDSVKRAIERLAEKGVIVRPPVVDEQSADSMGRSRIEQVYRIGKRDSYVIVAQLSPEFTARLVDRWQELEAASSPRLPTTAEGFAAAFQMLADNERIQAEQTKAIAAIETRMIDTDARLDRVEQVGPMSARPSNSEPLTRIQDRMKARFGLSGRVVSAVLRDSPYSLKPAGMVRNSHDNAGGAVYAIYWQKDVDALFKRFVSECQRVTKTLWSHPYVDWRFPMVGEEGEASFG